jgi:hypothetical protein
MGYKSDIQATYITETGLAIQPVVRLKAISFTPNGSGVAHVILTNGAADGAVLFEADSPSSLVYTLNLPEDGIPFPKGVYCSTITNCVSITLYTDLYSKPRLTPGN